MSYSGKVSSLRCQNLGVVQGSKTGPLYYDIYTSDFDNLCEEGEFIMFADDTCLLYSGDNLDKLTKSYIPQACNQFYKIQPLLRNISKNYTLIYDFFSTDLGYTESVS